MSRGHEPSGMVVALKRNVIMLPSCLMLLENSFLQVRAKKLSKRKTQPRRRFLLGLMVYISLVWRLAESHPWRREEPVLISQLFASSPCCDLCRLCPRGSDLALGGHTRTLMFTYSYWTSFPSRPHKPLPGLWRGGGEPVGCHNVLEGVVRDQ